MTIYALISHEWCGSAYEKELEGYTRSLEFAIKWAGRRPTYDTVTYDYEELEEEVYTNE